MANQGEVWSKFGYRRARGGVRSIKTEGACKHGFMSSVPVQFFQAGAGVVPTLMIAVVVGMKFGEGPAQHLEGKGKIGRIVVLVLAVLSIAGIFASEFVSLAALIRGGGTTDQAYVVWLGITIAFYFLAMEYLTPVKRLASKLESELLDWLVLALMIASFISAVLVLRTIE